MKTKSHDKQCCSRMMESGLGSPMQHSGIYHRTNISGTVKICMTVLNSILYQQTICGIFIYHRAFLFLNL